MLPPEIRLYLRQVRTSLGKSLDGVAQEVRERGQPGGHCNRTSLQRYELGKTVPDVVTLWRLAQVYQTPPHRLVEYVEWPVPQPCTCPCHSQREKS